MKRSAAYLEKFDAEQRRRLLARAASESHPGAANLSKGQGRFIVDSLEEVAEFFRYSLATIHKWREEGMPGAVKVERGVTRWDVWEIMGWYRGRFGKEDLSNDPAAAADTDFRTAKARMVILEYRKREGELVEISDVDLVFDRMGNLMRSYGRELGQVYGDDAKRGYDRNIDVLEQTLVRALEELRPSENAI